jgi:methyl-accepting chemotaxis protein
LINLGRIQEKVITVMWHSLSIAKKIYVSLGILVIGYTVTMLFVFVEGLLVKGRLTSVSYALFPASQQSQAALTAFNQQTKAYEDAVTVGDKKLLEVAQQEGESAAQLLEGIGKMTDLSQPDLEKVREVVEQLKAYSTDAQELYTQMASGKMEQMEKAAGLNKQSEILKEQLSGLSEGFSKGLQSEIASITHATKRNQIIDGLAFICIVSISLLIILKVVDGTMQRIKKTIERLKYISDGEWDLTVRLDESKKDELGELSQCINLFVKKLQDIISQLSGNSVQLADSFGRLNETRLQIVNGSDEVAGQVSKVAAASGEMAATASEIASSCQRVAENSELAISTATDGSTLVQHTVEGMSKVAASVQETARAIGSLGSRSDQIGQIIGTIKEIADQTHLLALNAAIEAARAGEHGRGFGVVASEVRALAERTTKATNEIGEMIKSIQRETRVAVQAMEEGVKEVEQEAKEAERSGAALTAILNQIDIVASQVYQMATAAEQQRGMTSEITKHLQIISDVVNRNTRDAQESADATSQVDALACHLQELVAQFKVG